MAPYQFVFLLIFFWPLTALAESPKADFCLKLKSYSAWKSDALKVFCEWEKYLDRSPPLQDRVKSISQPKLKIEGLLKRTIGVSDRDTLSITRMAVIFDILTEKPFHPKDCEYYRSTAIFRIEGVHSEAVDTPEGVFVQKLIDKFCANLSKKIQTR